MLDQIDLLKHDILKVKKGNPVPVNIFIVLLVLLYVAFVNHIVPLLIILIVVFIDLLTLRKGIEANISAMHYRDYYQVFGVTYGTWKRLAEFDYLLISKTQKRRGMFGQTGTYSVDVSTIHYDINIITKGEGDVLIYRMANYEKAVAAAKEFAAKHNLKISEKTSEGYIWL
ncbi:MAG: hypothetical protein ACKVPJ_05745 [Chitinophagales bacterium]